MTLPVTLSGGVLIASWKLLQFLSSLIVKVILAIFCGASAQLDVNVADVIWVAYLQILTPRKVSVVHSSFDLYSLQMHNM